MPLASWYALHWFGPGAMAAVDADGAGAVIATASGVARANQVTQAAGSVPLAKATRLRNSPMVTSGAGAMVQALPKGRARPSLIVRVNELSQDDVAGALQSLTIEPGVTFAEAMRLMLAFAAGSATGLNGPTAVFKSQDGTRDRITATVAGGNRTVTATDPD